jgi:VanZ family protein
MNKKRLILRLPAVAVVAGIFILSSQSALPHLEGPFGIDKIQHAFAYLCLSFSIGLWFRAQSWKQHTLRCFAVSFAIASLYGLSDEIHQAFVPNRSPDVLDWAADSTGALIGAALCLLAMHLYTIIQVKRKASCVDKTN